MIKTPDPQLLFGCEPAFCIIGYLFTKERYTFLFQRLCQICGKFMVFAVFGDLPYQNSRKLIFVYEGKFAVDRIKAFIRDVPSVIR